ncbi:MAG: hypothetical protein LQ340_006399 [Diploschistes diacapsis]|nr:MAG: hypothetical protein LQ340_006399 [Diploschistes diacapsis]
MKFFSIFYTTQLLLVSAIAAPIANENVKLKVRGELRSKPEEYMSIIERSISNLALVKREYENAIDPDEDGSLGVCLKVKRDIDSLFE